MKITAVLLNKSSQVTETIKSLLDFGIDEVLIGNYKPLDAKFSKVKPIKLETTFDYSKDLNNLVEKATYEYIFYVKEGEIIVEFDNQIDKVCGFQIIQNDTLLKEPRLWNKKETAIKFKNPVFEKLEATITSVNNTIIYQQAVKDERIEIILDKWKKSNPFSVDYYYYKAFLALGKRDFKEFKSLITYYLFNLKKADISTTMAKYYLAIIQGLVEDEVTLAMQNLTFCIKENPLMAEFWCLLGDIFLKYNDYGRAIEFYKNGMILGSRRLKSDLWPMQMSKYKEYPNEMMDKCRNILNNSKTLISKPLDLLYPSD